MSNPEPRPVVSVIIPTRNRLDKLKRCLESVRASRYPALEVIVVDDASREEVGPRITGLFPGVKVVRNPTRRFLSCSRNAGAAAASGEYLFFLDDDNVIDPDSIGWMVKSIDGPGRIAVSAPVIYYLAKPDSVWTSYITRSRFPGFYDLQTTVPNGDRETFSFHNSFLVRASLFSELGGFDCANFPIRFSEVDFAHRMDRRGYRAVVNPRSRVWHDLGWSLVHIDTSRAYYTERNRMIVIKRYYPRRDFLFYAVCLLPFIGAYYLLHHPLSSSEGRLETASSFLRGILSGLRFRENRIPPS